MKKIYSGIAALLVAGLVCSCGMNSGSGEAEIESITLDDSSAKTVFYPGDTFTASALLVQSNYVDNTSKKVPLKNCSFKIDGNSITAGSSSFSESDKGDHTITVSYKGCSGDYSIKVLAASEYVAPTFLDNYASIAAWKNRYQWNLANTHDPTVFKWTDGYYYMFGTDASYGNAHDDATKGKHFFGKRSVDLVHWEYVNGIMNDAPSWVATKLNEIRAKMGLDGIAESDISFGYWAPCARVVEVDGVKKVRMYYSIVVDNYIGNGKPTSDSANFDNTWGERAFIGVAESTNPAGGPSAWKDLGFVTCSSSDKALDYSRTSTSDWSAYFYFNAIDPSYFIDDDGTHWLVYGSWHSGFALVRINPSTGKIAAVDGDDYLTGTVTGDFAMGDPWADSAEGLVKNGYGTRIFARGTSRWQPSEGPELVKYDGKYWLFFANDGLDVPYQTRVVCADSVKGPYYAFQGSEMTNDVDGKRNGSTSIYPILTHPYKFSDEEPASGGYGSCYGWVGISHCAVFQDDDGNWYYMSQQRLPANVADNDYSNAIMMGGVRRILWSPTGSSKHDTWPMVLPERYGAIPSSYNPDANATDGKISASEIPGTWQHINLVYDSTGNGNMDEASELVLATDYTMSGALTGTWSFNESDQTLTLGDVTVSLAREVDWEKVPRVPTIVYTGASSTNYATTYWGKKEPSSD